MNQVVEYNLTDAAISEMESLYMGLIITDLENKEEFDAVHSARMVVKGKRVDVEKRRKELKADALEWGRRVDSEAKRIFGKLEPIETHLMDEENKVIEEQKRIKEEQDRKEREQIQVRVDSLLKYGVSLPFMEVATMPAEEFETTLLKAKAAYEAEQDRIAEEKRIEAERLEKERLEREAEQKRLTEERAELEKIRKDMEDREAAAQAKRDAENAKAQQEQAALEAEKRAFEEVKRKEQERKDREASEAIAKEEARVRAEQEAKEIAEREAALRPDRQKIKDWCNSLSHIPVPEVESPIAASILRHSKNRIQDEVRRVQEEVGGRF